VRDQRPLPPKGAREDVILFNVGGFRFAIAAGAVSEIRSLEGLQPFAPGSGYMRITKVDFTLERGGVTYFIVDGGRHFHLARLEEPSPARVLILRQEAVAVSVDSTDRMVEISMLHALPQAFSGEERSWYRGLAVLNGDVVPVVNHNAFLSKAELVVLKTAALRLKKAAAV